MVPIDAGVKTGNTARKVLLISYPRQLKQNRCHTHRKKGEKINQNLKHVTKERIQATVIEGHTLI